MDIIAVPSTAYESLPLVVLEAMAAGTPVLASRLSGIPEAVLGGETGRLFDPGDPDELARLLLEACKDRPGLAEMGRQARERWERVFSLARMLDSILDLYESLVPGVGVASREHAELDLGPF